MKMYFSFMHFDRDNLNYHIKDYQYWIIMQGSGTIFSDQQTYIFTGFDVFKFPADNDIQVFTNRPVDIGCVTLSDYIITNRLITHYSHEKTELVRKIFLLAYEIFASADIHKQGMENTVVQLMFEAFVNLGIENKKIPLFIQNALEEMHHNGLNTDYDIKDTIKKSGYSSAHFRKKFQDETGLSPLQYLLSLRIEHATKLMHRTSGLTIRQIALESGFTDVYYFSRIFKKQKGIAPSEYMKSIFT